MAFGHWRKAQVLLTLLVLLPFVGALQTYPQGSDVDLVHSVRVSGAVDPASNCNITVFLPNKSVMIDFQPMTDSGNYFNYTLNETQTSLKGEYHYDVTCTNGEFNRTEGFDFLINLGGVSPSQERTDTTTRSIALFVILGSLFFVGMLILKSFPLKVTMFLLTLWMFLISVNTSFLALQDEVVNTSFETFFSFFTVLSFYANWFIMTGLVVFWAAILLINAVDHKRQRSKDRYGLE